MNRSELSRMAGAIDDSTINIVVVTTIIIIIITKRLNDVYVDKVKYFCFFFIDSITNNVNPSAALKIYLFLMFQ